jgi:Ca2+-binding RTX toxin-like protein
MTTIVLSQSFLESDLSGLTMPSAMEEVMGGLFAALQQDYPIDGNSTNPTVDSELGSIMLTGSTTFKEKTDGSTTSSYKFKSATILGELDDAGKPSTTLKVDGSFAGSHAVDVDGNEKSEDTHSVKSVSFTGDGTKWSVAGGYSLRHKADSNSDADPTFDYTENYKSFSSTDANGNSITFAGNIMAEIDPADESIVYSGSITSATLVLGKTGSSKATTMKATGLKLTFDDLAALNGEDGSGTMADYLPLFLAGNDTITIAPGETLTAHGYAGSDKITGSAGDDVINGGSGADKLTGGKGADVFEFDIMQDFFDTKNDNATFNKKYADTITDFKVSDGDTLDFGDYDLQIYDTLRDAQDDSATLFYVNKSGKIYLNTDATGDNYSTAVIINLTGKPDLSVDA